MVVPLGQRGGALRSRLAAQADAAFASTEDNRLRQLLLKEPASSEEWQEQMAAAEKLLLERPPQSSSASAQREPPLDVKALQEAARSGDLKTLAQKDKRLKALLDSEDMARLLKSGDVSDPLAQEALNLYRESFMYLERHGKTDRQAFLAVMQDNVEELQELLNGGISANARNSGGHTLLQLARERGKTACIQALLEAGAVDETDD